MDEKRKWFRFLVNISGLILYCQFGIQVGILKCLRGDDGREISVLSMHHPPQCECGMCTIAKINKNLVQDQQTVATIYSQNRRPKRLLSQKKGRTIAKKFHPCVPFFTLGQRRREIKYGRKDEEQVKVPQSFVDTTAIRQDTSWEKEIQSTPPTSFQDEILPFAITNDSVAKLSRYHNEIHPIVTTDGVEVRPAHHILPVVNDIAAPSNTLHKDSSPGQRTYGLLDLLAIVAVVDTAVYLTYYNEDTVPDMTFHDTVVRIIFHHEDIPPDTDDNSATQTTSSNEEEIIADPADHSISFHEFISPADTIEHTATQTSSCIQEKAFYDDDAMYGILGVYSNRI